MIAEKFSNWIWTGSWREVYDSAPKLVLFRKEVWFAAKPMEARLRISADSRYKLYINGVFVEAGPSKGDREIWFVDELDIAPYLQEGGNALAVMVLRYPQTPGKGNQSIISTPLPGLYLTGDGKDAAGTVYSFSADASWKSRVDDRVEFVPESAGFAPLHIYERVCEASDTANWKQAGYDDEAWESARPYERQFIRDAVSPGNLQRRTIPFMRRKARQFRGIINCDASGTAREQWNRMLHGGGAIRIPPGGREIVEIDAGEEMTGYLRLLLEGGRGAEIKLLQSEAYVQEEQTAEGMPVKTDRMDAVSGHLEGFCDSYCAAGYGTQEMPECYEPFWFRTFRFIRLSVTTGEQPLLIHGFDYAETGYPLDVKTSVETSDPSLGEIWAISERTLRRCMHETYMDCPFYEQLQYVMDSRSQALYTYTAAADDRLARKCLDDFKRSQRYDGLLSSAYPNTRPNVIPGFSIYYILMLHDHMMYFGDRDLVRYHMPSVESVLYFFESHCTPEGYVGKIGGFYRRERFWSFVDWAPGWSVGVPGAAAKGPLTLESLLYILGLQHAAELAEFAGRPEQAADYRARAELVRNSIRSHCIGDNCMVQDGPGVAEYSQHCQVFAVLTNTITPEAGRKNLLRTLEDKDAYVQCTVSMALYLFRALEKTGLYAHTDGLWDIWRRMLANNMTTCAESDAYSRSECHAWGALALYELPAVILGLRPAAPGFKQARIDPTPGYLSCAAGEAVTPKGIVRISWHRDKTGIHVEYEAPDDMEITVPAR